MMNIKLWTQCENKQNITGYKIEENPVSIETMGLGFIKKSEAKYVRYFFENNEDPKLSKNISPM